MSWIDDITNNAIKAGQAIGLCDSIELRKLKDENEKSKLEIEKKTREDEYVKNQYKVMSELKEMSIDYKAAMLYATAKSGNMEALLEFLKPKEIAKNPKVNESKFDRVRTEKPAKPADAPEAEGLAN